MRQQKTYNPQERREIYENLMCTYCGNTDAFSINLKLKHEIQQINGQLEVMLNKAYTDKVLGVITQNLDKLVERCYDGRRSFTCANCDQSESIDMHERVLDTCYNMGCPGCFWCGNYIDKQDLIDTCRACILERRGNVDEEYCSYSCPAYDNGLQEVRDYYDMSLRDMKRELGFI